MTSDQKIFENRNRPTEEWGAAVKALQEMKVENKAYHDEMKSDIKELVAEIKTLRGQVLSLSLSNSVMKGTNTQCSIFVN